MIRAIALDDEPLALQVLREFGKKTEGLELSELFTRPHEALAYLEAHPVDLLFLDIEMPLLSGIELYKRLPAPVPVIFTTAYPQYAVEGFDLKAVDYLLKPFSFARFCEAVGKAREFIELRSRKKAPEFISVRADYGMQRVRLDEIVYIEGQDNYLKIHFAGGKHLLLRMALKAMQEQLPAERFARIHRSYIVSREQVTAYRNRTVYLGDVQIPVGNAYAQQAETLFAS